MKKVLFILLIAILFFNLCSCVNYGNFCLISQKEKREYVKQELFNLYGIDCDISEI